MKNAEKYQQKRPYIGDILHKIFLYVEEPILYCTNMLQYQQICLLVYEVFLYISELGHIQCNMNFLMY